MKQGFLPHSLDRGITLEDGSVLIPWGTRIDELVNLESATVLKREDSVHVTWHNRLCLGGLRCDVSAIQILERPRPRAYHIYLPEFHFASMRMQPTVDESEIAVEFKRTFRHLENELGPPSFSYPKYEGELPAIFWEYAGVTVGYMILAGRTLSIRHEPSGYDELKEEAKRIRSREGEGARVNYVAW